jgi:hypothetical protein
MYHSKTISGYICEVRRLRALVAQCGKARGTEIVKNFHGICANYSANIDYSDTLGGYICELRSREWGVERRS